MNVFGKAGDTAWTSGNASVIALLKTIASSAVGGGSSAVTGNVASGAADSGNPVKVGGVYLSALPTYTTGQRGDILLGQRGAVAVCEFGAAGADAVSNATIATSLAQNNTGGYLKGVVGHVFNGTSWDRIRGDTSGTVTTPYAMVGSRKSFAGASGGIVNTTTAVTMFAAAGAGLRTHLTDLQITWDTLGAATELVIRDGASGTVLWRDKLPTAAGSKVINFQVPLKGTANTLMEIATLTASVTGGVFVNAQAFSAA